jgi:hypothetical protein
MPLSPEDMQAIGQLLDQRMLQQDQKLAARLEAQERKRRRFWFWFIWLSILATILSSVLMGIWAKRFMGAFQGMVSELDSQRGELVQVRMEYAKELEHNRQMQRDRAEAVARSGYQSEQSQSQFDAGLLSKTLQLFNRTREASDHMRTAEKNGAPSVADDEQSMKDLSQTLDSASSMMVQLLLHESDPVHAGSAEHIEHADTASHAAIKQDVDPALAAGSTGAATAPPASR